MTIAFHLAVQWKREFQATPEVTEEEGKQSDISLTKVNHPKGWGAKPLI